jgi:hypothetical protein
MATPPGRIIERTLAARTAADTAGYMDLGHPLDFFKKPCELSFGGNIKR